MILNIINKDKVITMEQDRQPLKKSHFASMLHGKTKLLILVLIVALAVGTLAFNFMGDSNDAIDHTNYPLMETYSMPGNVAGSGLSFTKPVDFIKYVESSDQVVFQQPLINAHNKKSIVAYLAVSSTSVAQAYTTSQLMALKETLAITNPNYGIAVSPINQFIKDRLPTGWQINLDKPATYLNKSIQDNAWQFNFSASDTINKNDPFKGQVLYAISGKNLYFIMIATTSDNWQENQNTWQKIFDSFQIDH